MNLLDNLIEFKPGKTSYRFLPTGDIFEFNHNGIMLNEFCGNSKDGSPNNIYLRIYKENSIIAHPLLGIRSHSVLKKSDNSLLYTGKIENISYEVIFYAIEGIWFWEVALAGNGETVDLLYGQDIGVASQGGVLTNELYAAQYLGHSVFETENGYTLCSRQNQDQGGVFPYLRQGGIGSKIIHYSTDGMQFFKTSYKDTDIPAALTEDLPDVNYQFEFSYTALQTEKFKLDSLKKVFFYGLAKEDHPEAISTLEFDEEINAAYNSLKKETYVTCPAVTLKAEFGAPYSSPSLSNEKIFSLFPSRTLEEYEKDTLLSFFTKDHSHIVTKEKELRTERPHGTIFITCPDTLQGDAAKEQEEQDQGVMSSTAYMYGLFNGQTVLGNTSFHKLLSTPRGLINIQKNCGQHLYVKLQGTYRLLTLPALFEMGMNYARWYYVIEDDLLSITSYTAAHKPFAVLEVTSLKAKQYDFILTNQLVLGENEHAKDLTYTEIPGGLRFADISTEYPDLHFDMLFTGAQWQAGDDRIFFEDGLSRDDSFLTIKIKETGSFKCIIRGSFTAGQAEVPPSLDFEEEKAAANQYYKQLNRDFQLQTDKEELNARIEILNQTSWWYTHNAMIHFSSPHGLEQPGGAAWGTRDVCQGPMEYFLMTQNYELAGRIILNIFSHQSHSTGEWPQWFMFDRYTMDAGECHGDVVFWPLKCIGDYLEASGDYALLQKEIPYSDEKGQKASLLLHIKRAFEAILERFIGDTGLITYAGGDWDDTLQPVDPILREHLVSSWTVALAFQTLKRLGAALKDIDEEFAKKLTERSEKIAADFESLLIKDDIIPGFVLYDNRDIKYMLHPLDTETGIKYRLLPMTRSIIAELVSPDQAQTNMQTIKKQLKFPDGVHLMSRPARYSGGVSKLFKRAEQAANVGREISLLYTHAHIRYLEACAKIGDGNTAWDSLFTINPIQIQASVPTACLRQSNMYFSSSDGMFMDRYDFAENFDKLKSGSIPVKAGWRLYSSGPGIYLNQLVSNILGIRFLPDSLVLDPVLSDSLDGLKLTYTCFEKEVTFCYRMVKSSNEKEYQNLQSRITVSIGGTPVTGEVLSNPYREGGLKIDRKVLENASNQIDIFVKLP
ncbi:Cellobiose phosphorylase [Anaerocolumna jejuensis DSM 15929]|uniref:Cellobiose phosphorylase n=1 Tax=Anaerocolumna jejuensis DSM 15929 TaxID=1121322 RepID=A0A1M6SR73_9FIRM|nr:hypothetical protein [Anaerocolumna jejuensis]SHK47088.1 Cellobiose phosphorylase [Anaerocolumna jejuensis DSM 15929]